MFIALLLIFLTVLPHLWEYIFSKTLSETDNPNRSQLVVVAFMPLSLLVLISLLGTGWATSEVIVAVVLFIIILNTLSWGFVMYYRTIAPPWIWLLMVFLTFCLLLLLLFLALFGSSSGWNLNF
tara:strand:- start:148 stop:519 length:372 start_codon:yes stop_codon:yes gene_type:complete